MASNDCTYSALILTITLPVPYYLEHLAYKFADALYCKLFSKSTVPAYVLSLLSMYEQDWARLGIRPPKRMSIANVITPMNMSPTQVKYMINLIRTTVQNVSIIVESSPSKANANATP